jgi:hypothetical protein
VHVRLGRSEILFAREEQRDVDRHAPEYGFLNRRDALLGSRNLDEQIGPGSGSVKRTRGLDRPLRVIGEERRHFERDPAIDAGGPIMDRPEEIGGLLQISDRKPEEQIFARNAAFRHRANVLVVGDALRNRMVEDRRVRGEPRDRKRVDVSFERARRQQIPSDVVEPQALTRIAKRLGRIHVRTPGLPIANTARSIMTRSPTFEQTLSAQVVRRGIPSDSLHRRFVTLSSISLLILSCANRADESNNRAAAQPM